MEMPGLEESMADFNYVPEEDDEDEESLQDTKKEVAVLKKKLKRVEKFIKEATTPQEIENLENKLDEYMMALEEEESKLRTLQAVVEESSNASYNDINSPGSLSEEATRRREELTQQQEEEE
jgi:flagellar hook-basal body complex protein FliE